MRYGSAKRKHRSRVPRRSGRRSFSRTASKMNGRNHRSSPMRGGYRI